MSYGSVHWRLYNVHRRLLGIGALLACLAFLWSAVSLWLRLRAAELGETKATGYEYLVGAVLSFCLGWILVRMRPYRPDQGDVSFWAGRAGGYPEASRAFQGEPRSWWTGEYHDRPDASRERAADD